MMGIDHASTCIDCGAEFCRYTSRQTRCKACQKVHMREYKRAYNRRYWNDNGEIYRAAARARRSREKGGAR